MHYDICMRSIERIEDALSDAWQLHYVICRTAFDNYDFTFQFPDFETLDFE